jgi:hypothetical protein
MHPTAPGLTPETRTNETVRFRELSMLPQRVQEETPVAVNPNPPKGNVPTNLPTSTGTPGGEPTVTPAQFNELAAKFESMESKFTEQGAALVQANEANSRLTTQLEAATTNISTRQASARRRRFSDMALGRSGPNDGGHAWIGEVEDHVAILESLVASEADENGAYHRYIKTQRAAAEQSHMNNQLAASAARTVMTNEVGSAALGRTSGSARSEADGLVKKMREAQPTLTVAAAENELWQAQPDLYGRVRDEERRYAKENGTR